MSEATKEIELNKLSLDQLNGLKEQHQQEIENYKAQHGDLASASARFRESLNAVKNLKKGPLQKPLGLGLKKPLSGPLLVPMTQSLYVPGELVDVDKVLVDIGTGYFLEKSTQDAKDLLERRLDLLSKNADSIASVLLQKQRNLEAIVMMMQWKLKHIQESKAQSDRNR